MIKIGVEYKNLESNPYVLSCCLEKKIGELNHDYGSAISRVSITFDNYIEMSESIFELLEGIERKTHYQLRCISGFNQKTLYMTELQKKLHDKKYSNLGYIKYDFDGCCIYISNKKLNLSVSERNLFYQNRISLLLQYGSVGSFENIDEFSFSNVVDDGKFFYPNRNFINFLTRNQFGYCYAETSYDNLRPGVILLAPECVIRKCVDVLQEKVKPSYGTDSHSAWQGPPVWIK